MFLWLKKRGVAWWFWFTLVTTSIISPIIWAAMILGAEGKLKLPDPAPELAITLSTQPEHATPGGNLTYMAYIANTNGPAEAVSITLTLPPGVTYVSSTPGFPACIQEDLAVTCAMGNKPKNAVGRMSVLVRVDGPAGASLSSTATVGSESKKKEGDVANNTASVVVTVR